MLTLPGSVPGNASRELVVGGHSTHYTVGQERNKTSNCFRESESLAAAATVVTAAVTNDHVQGTLIRESDTILHTTKLVELRRGAPILPLYSSGWSQLLY